MVKKIEWNDINYVRAYRFAKQGLSDRAIAQHMGVNYFTFRAWVKNKKTLREALEMARSPEEDGAVRDFQTYVFNQLPEHLRSLWEDIESFADSRNSIERIESLLVKEGLRARQHLFIYALTSSNFDMSRACKAVNVRPSDIKRWVSRDPDFGELLDEIHWHKKNFFEHALIKLVKRGDPQAVLFANRTQNRDRGYNDKVVVDVNGTINHHHTHSVKIKDLNLPIETRRLLLQKIREVKANTVDGKVERS